MATTRQLLSCALLGATATLAVVFLTGAKRPAQKFDEIDVGRINIREPDGTLRMVISNRAQFPGTPWKGEEISRPERRQFAGMLFVDDEGTENGGLIQKGYVGSDGRTSAGLSLTFDRFRQDQVIQLLHAEDGGKALSMLAINDETDGTKFDVMQRVERLDSIRKLDRESGRVALQEMKDSNQLPRNRVRLGTTMDGGAALVLADAKGRPRLMLLVSAEGGSSMRMLNEKGEVMKTMQLEASPAGSQSPEASTESKRN